MEKIRKTLSALSGIEIPKEEFDRKELLTNILFSLIAIIALTVASIIADFV